MENRNILIGLGTGLVAGLLGGFGLGYWMGTNQGHSHPAAAPATAQAPGMPPAGVPPAGVPPQGMGTVQVDAFARISATKAALERDPKNFEAWVQLGNDYFDTHQPQLSVDAYAKAIALKPNHPQ
ncbi:MAG TPA: tetratricopeptide repeat protein, partial [Holophaga sp.]|nr:tetratricopeptide repeat protein [Holophaga sp.]